MSSRALAMYLQHCVTSRAPHLVLHWTLENGRVRARWIIEGDAAFLFNDRIAE